jgi:hypothetical protein
MRPAIAPLLALSDSQISLAGEIVWVTEVADKLVSVIRRS